MLQIPAVGVDEAFGSPRRTGGVHDEERVLGRKTLRPVFRCCECDRFVPPHITATFPRYFTGPVALRARAAHHDHLSTCSRPETAPSTDSFTPIPFPPRHCPSGVIYRLAWVSAN